MALNNLLGKIKSNSEKLINTVGQSEIAAQVTSKVGNILGDSSQKDGEGKSELSMASIKKQMNMLVKEKAKMYEFIGMEIYDLYKNENLEIPQIEAFYKKLDGLEGEIKKLDNMREEKKKKKKTIVCECGTSTTDDQKFCPGCGKKLLKEMIICNCGNEISEEIKFCPNCGTNREMLKESSDKVESAKVECVCGAMVGVDELMCMECGRRIMSS